ncbi:MAG: TIGR03557 family F420-dependent LLM class oxidoreductase [Thermoprotei archaeon]
MAIRFGYRAAQEEHDAVSLIRNSVHAEQLGFEFIVVSDHFHPWFNTDAHACFAMSWLGALGQATKSVRFGTGVTPPIGRYHPGLVAQAFGTLGVMFPGRSFVAVGTGEAMNELPLGFPWPGFEERLERLREGISIIRKLWTEDFVTFKGKYYTLNSANIYDKPAPPPSIYVAAAGAKSARLAGEMGDALMTVPARPETYGALFDHVREGCKSSGKEFEKMPKMIEVFIGYDKDYDDALAHLARWKTVLIPDVFAKPVSDPRILEQEAAEVDPKLLTDVQATVCTSVDDVVSAAEKYIKLGFNEIQIHSCSRDEQGFLNEFGAKGLPYLKETYGRN